ncbi:hypothetical protein LJB99_01315 [Deltaproteobacteria bacterium OttesenSCG-928-K17]|nr:hypothetical protein [Deltaproteobacteria bacterium OttesenSCG-928-K17]
MNKTPSKKSDALTTLDAIFFIVLTCVICVFAAISWREFNIWGLSLRFVALYSACSAAYFIVKSVLKKNRKMAKTLSTPSSNELEKLSANLTTAGDASDFIEAEFKHEDTIEFNPSPINNSTRDRNEEVIEEDEANSHSGNTDDLSVRLKILAEEHENRRMAKLEKINLRTEKQNTSSTKERQANIKHGSSNSGLANNSTGIKKTDEDKAARIKIAIQKCRLAKVIYDDYRVYDRAGRLLGVVKPNTMKILDSAGELIALHSYHSFSVNGKKVGTYDKTVIKDSRGRPLITIAEAGKQIATSHDFGLSYDLVAPIWFCFIRGT